MGVAEVIQKAKRLRDRAIDTRTQQKHVERMRSFFSWCENREEVRPNLLFRVRLNPQGRNKERKQHRRPFEPSELQSIFAPDRIRQAATPFQFWMPLMGYYTGARVNELAQLYVDDVIQVNERWFFDIAMDRPGQRIKSIAARRLIPVHPHLLELGLLVFVQQAKSWGRSRLFPDVIWGRNGPGETVSRWFARLVRELDFPAHQTFHAFRNTFVMHAAAANILQEKYSELTGHAVNGSNVITTFYLRTQDAAERCAIYDRIKFPMIAHAPYEPAKFERVFRRASAVDQHEERLREAFGDKENRS
jgi:integrase